MINNSFELRKNSGGNLFSPARMTKLKSLTIYSVDEMVEKQAPISTDIADQYEKQCDS